MTIRVAVAVMRRDGRILVCQRKKGARYELKWEFPGGKLEPGETALHCLERELREELSIQLLGIEKIELQTAVYDDGGRYEVAYCFVSRFSGEPTNNVFETVRWVSLDELRTLDILEGNKKFVAQLTHE
ncbi:MAG TPA: (deoxy)nucleoside triphosphate pyrophosphohydrolase [Bacteroidota bacterium]